MVQAAKIIGICLAVTGLIGAGFGKPLIKRFRTWKTPH